MSKLRAALLLLAFGPSLLACATDASGDDPTDVDGGGKGDTATSSDPNRLLDMPFYFSVPKTAVTAPVDRTKYPYPTVWNASMQASAVGLRVIAIQEGAGVAAHQMARREMATKLAQAGVLQDGDIVLTFRPELADTMAYPHIQMGTTHAGLVYTDGGAAFNIDSPLDSASMCHANSEQNIGSFVVVSVSRMILPSIVTVWRVVIPALT
jgi:hypothetical protein